MGSCVSSTHNNNIKTSSDSPIKLSALIAEPETTSSPVKNDVINPATIKGNSFIDSTAPRDSSEEITFFDSRGWLDSDCDDDFMSVDGESTPSRGTTPVHHKFCDQAPKAVETKHDQEEPSPTDNKKRLLELFKETQDQDEDEKEDDVVAEGKARACLWLRTPARSSAPATPYNSNNDTERQQLKRVKSAAQGGCVLRLVSCSSFTERRRKMMSHTPVRFQR